MSMMQSMRYIIHCRHHRPLAQITLGFGYRNFSVFSRGSQFINVTYDTDTNNDTMCKFSKVTSRCKSSSASIPKTMQCWEAYSHGGPDQLSLSNTTRVPIIKGTDDVLVRVHAASVNPIDVRMLSGYGKSTLNAIRTIRSFGKNQSEFPLVLGKDFSGEVVAVGKRVKKTLLKPGDKVFGCVDPISTTGSHSEYVITKPYMVVKRDLSLTDVEAASLPYVAMTAWSALTISGGLSKNDAYPKKKVLILGGSGGIGTFAIQLLRSWGVEVSVVCPPEGQDLVVSLGADLILDSSKDTFREDLQAAAAESGGYDLVLNLVPGDIFDWSSQLLKKGALAKFVTLNAPILTNNDQYGLLLGPAKTLLTGGVSALKHVVDSGSLYRYALFLPNTAPLHAINELVSQHKMVPVVGQVYPFSELPAAYEVVATGQAQGKVVVDFLSN